MTILDCLSNLLQNFSDFFFFPPGMLMRKATVEELQSEDSPFKKRQIRVSMFVSFWCP